MKSAERYFNNYYQSLPHDAQMLSNSNDILPSPSAINVSQEHYSVSSILGIVLVTAKKNGQLLTIWYLRIMWHTLVIITPPPVGGWGIVFARFFDSLSATLRENGWTDLREIFGEGVE